MLFWLILSLFLPSFDGAPSSSGGCVQISVDDVFTDGNYRQDPRAVDELTLRRHNVTVKLLEYGAISTSNNLCVGTVDVIVMKLGQCEKDTLCMFFDDHKLAVQFGTLLKEGFPQTVKYSCAGGRTQCIELKLSSIFTSLPTLLVKRNVASSVTKSSQPHPLTKPVFPSWTVVIIAVCFGMVLLSIATVLCVKRTENEVNLTQPSGLRIIDGPPREYHDSRPSRVRVTEHHNETNSTTTQEATMKIEQPSSPDTLSGRTLDSVGSPGVQEAPKHKKAKDPLPPTPKRIVNPKDPLPPTPKPVVNPLPPTPKPVVNPLPPTPKPVVNPLPPTPKPVVNHVEDNEDEEEEENPYELAETDGDDDENPVNLVRPPLPPGGSYAKVSRHSGNGKPTSSYAEVSEMRHTHVGRVRSSTEPVEPLPPLPPSNKLRTLSGGEGGHLPLPLPPLNLNTVENNYDSIRNDIHSALTEEEKVYDSLDDENEDMYESVPEDLKEELVSMNPSTPVPVPPRSPKGVDSLSGSPSPTKLPINLGSPDSPTRKKQSKKSKRKARSESSAMEDDIQKPKQSFMDRFRSNSTSTAVGKGRKEGKRGKFYVTSPEHHFSHPPNSIPPPPPLSGSIDENDDEDDENGMYDSVDPAQILDIKARSTSLPPPGTRSSLLFNPRTAEPLPEVPEDSGSGSKGAVMVKRERVTETDDPNYDVVVGLTHSMQRSNSHKNEEEEDEEEEDNYDTVKPRGIRNPHDHTQSPPSHSYAKVTAHNSLDKSVDHDDKGYAVVNPDTVIRKRVASMSKQMSMDKDSKKEDDIDEPPYDRVKKDDEIDEPPYDRVKKDDDVDEPPYDMVKKDDEIDEPPYDRIKKDDEIDEPPYDRIKKDDDIDEPPYDRVKRDDDIDEPPYDRVKKDDEPPHNSVNSKQDTVNGCKDIEVEQTMGVSEPGVPVYPTVTGSQQPGSGSDSTHGNQDTQPPVLFTFTTETIMVQEETYSLVDLGKKHELRRKKEQWKNGEVLDAPLPVPLSPVGGVTSSTSSTPPLLPPVGDLGDMSEFIPPPIPSPLIDLVSEGGTPNYISSQSDDDNEVDPNYDIVGPVKSAPLPTQNGTIAKRPEIDPSSIDAEDTEKQTNSEQSQSSCLLPETETLNIYDSLEPQQVTYDSLEPKEGRNTYDSLEGAQNQS